MKKFLSLSLAILVAVASYGQSYQRNGKEFSAVKKERAASNSEGNKTGFTWKDSKGKVYDIYISPKGSCYIIRISSKTGKKYKSYLPKDVSEEIKRILK